MFLVSDVCQHASLGACPNACVRGSNDDDYDDPSRWLAILELESCSSGQ